MRVDSINSYSIASRKVHSNGQNKKVSTPQRPVQPQMTMITFAGKNMWQGASFTPENNGLGLKEAKRGGEGVVGYEGPTSMNKHEKVKVKLADGRIEEKKVDMRSFMPFWEHNNPKGGYKFLIHRDKDYPGGFKAVEHKEMPASAFYSAEVGEDLQAVANKLGLKTNELSYVIQSKPNGKGADAKSMYCILEEPKIKGKITRLSEKVLGEIEEVPYALLQISKNNPEYNTLKKSPNYFVYTPYLARAATPYSYDCWGNVPFEAEIVNSDWMRAMADFVHTKMNTEEFGYYDPASVWAHDRVAHTYGNHIANKSALGDTSVDGLKVHIVAHNTGRYYQGITGDPFKYMTVVGDASDAETIRALPDFELLKKAQQFGINSDQLSPRERQIVHAVIDPYLANFKDGGGTYNILKAGISAARLNPDNISTGTVSYNFAKEMKSKEMYDAAKFLTDDYAAIETKDVLNGSTPANLKLGNPTAAFGQDANNGLSQPENLKGFTPFTYVKESELDDFMAKLNDPKIKELTPETNQNITSDINKVVEARNKNAKWLTNLIAEADQKGHDELKKLFFNTAQIDDGADVLGHLSPIKDGEILIMGWGRPDEQKGYPMTMDGFVKFLKRKDIPQEIKQKVKLLVGAGIWNKEDRDYKAIAKAMKEIETLDGGIYKNNAMYIDGFFPNRLVSCAHYGIFTSRREMCGITPLECKAAGVPYGATATGGPVDYTNPSNGFLTKEPVEMNPQHYGLTWDNTPEEIDTARVNKQSEQVADIYKQMIEEYSNDKDAYIAKCKKNIDELIDWHNNSEYNFGKSANRRYLDDIWEVEKGWEARNKTPLKRIVGQFGEFKDDIESLMHNTKSKPVKVILSVVLGGLAVASGIYLYMHRNSKKQPQQIQENKPENNTIVKAA